MYRIPLKFLPNVEKVSQPIKIDLKIMCGLERSMFKPFESNKNVTALPTGKPVAKQIFNKASYVQ